MEADQSRFVGKMPEMNLPISMFPDGLQLSDHGTTNKGGDTLLVAPLTVSSNRLLLQNVL
jgi:hypothetical protein